MPIPLRDYQNELEPADSQILQILEKQPYQAYKISELTTISTDFTTALLEIFAFQSRMERLIKKGLVKSKHIKGGTYYISAKAG